MTGNEALWDVAYALRVMHPRAHGDLFAAYLLRVSGEPKIITEMHSDPMRLGIDFSPICMRYKEDIFEINDVSCEKPVDFPETDERGWRYFEMDEAQKAAFMEGRGQSGIDPAELRRIREEARGLNP